MDVPNGFRRDLGGQSTDHYNNGESEHCGSAPFPPALAASAVRIQHNTSFGQATDGSRSTDRGRYHPVPNGPSHGSGPGFNVFYSSLTHHDPTTHIQQHNHEWGPFVENLEQNHTLRSVQLGPSHRFVGFASPGDDGAYYRFELDGLRPTDGLSPSSTSAELESMRLQETPTYNAPTSYPNVVSGGEISFPRNGGPLVIHEPYHSPHRVARAVSTFGQAHPNQTELSGGSLGPRLIANEKNDSIAQHLASGSSQLDGDSSFPPRARMTVVPQRPYQKKRGRNNQEEPIVFNVNGLQGITARDAMRRIYTGLEGRDNQVFVDKCSVFTLRIEWPCYTSWSSKIRLNNWKKKPQRIKLEKLATEVVKRIEKFIEVKGGQAVEIPSDLVSSDLRVGPQFIGIDRLVLLSLEKVSKGSWQPVIGLLP